MCFRQPTTQEADTKSFDSITFASHRLNKRLHIKWLKEATKIIILKKDKITSKLRVSILCH